MSAEMEIVIAGETGTTNDVVVAFTVAATDENTLEQIPAYEITVGGQGITNGAAWQSYSEHSANGVGVSITNHTNWKAELTPAIHRLTMEGSGFAFVDADTNSSTYLQIVSYDSQPLQFPSTNVFKTLIGQKMTFTAGVPPATSGALVTNLLWTIGGDTVSNFVYGTVELTGTNGITVTQHVGKAIFDFPKTNLSASFAWWKTGLVTVKFSCEINNKAVSVQCKVDVTRPPAFIRPRPDGEDGIQIGKFYSEDDGTSARIKLGKGEMLDRGVMFELRGNQDYSEFGWIQIVNASARTLYRDQMPFTNTSGQVLTRTNIIIMAAGLDGSVFLPDSDPYYDSPKHAFASDSSGGNLGASISESFTLYLMFNPKGEGVWVPFQSVDWGWKAALTNSPALWVPNTNWPNSVAIEPIKVTPQYPSWTNKVVSGGQ